MNEETTKQTTENNTEDLEQTIDTEKLKKRLNWITKIPIIGNEINDWKEIIEKQAHKIVYQKWIEGWKEKPYELIRTTLLWIFLTAIIALTVIIIDQDVKYCTIQDIHGQIRGEMTLIEYLKNPEQYENTTTDTRIYCGYDPIRLITERYNMVKDFNKFQEGKTAISMNKFLESQGINKTPQINLTR